MSLARFNLEPQDIPDIALVAMTGIAVRLGIARQRLSRENRQLQHDATHDSLTGLPNRAMLMTELDREIEENPGGVGVIFVDLDGLKTINDTLGHKAGDTFIQTAADNLNGGSPNKKSTTRSDRRAYRKLRTVAATTIAATIRTDNEKYGDERRENHKGGDTLGWAAFRLAGDEFVVIARGADTQEKVDRLMEQLETNLGERDIEASMDGRPHRPGETATELVSDVDAKMYVKKRARKDANKRAEISALPLGKRLWHEVGQLASKRSGVSKPTR